MERSVLVADTREIEKQRVQTVPGATSLHVWSGKEHGCCGPAWVHGQWPCAGRGVACGRVPGCRRDRFQGRFGGRQTRAPYSAPYSRPVCAP
eukprot:2998593-Lingulodinium_polyedra.AAC.1